jgi:hypothetical protein
LTGAEIIFIVFTVQSSKLGTGKRSVDGVDDEFLKKFCFFVKLNKMGWFCPRQWFVGTEMVFVNFTVLSSNQGIGQWSVDGMDDDFLKKISIIEMVSMIFHGREYFRFG